MKGRTKWFPRTIKPVRPGHYECIVRICPGHAAIWFCEWDGIGFLCPHFIIIKWRGLTTAEYAKLGAGKGEEE